MTVFNGSIGRENKLQQWHHYSYNYAIHVGSLTWMLHENTQIGENLVRLFEKCYLGWN